MTKTAYLALAIVAAAAGCSSGTDTAETTERPTEGVTAAQLRAFDALEARTTRSWVWVQHGKWKTPMHLASDRAGAPVLTKGTDAANTTLRFVAQYKDLFKMRDPARELSVSRVEVDQLGMTHARFQQKVHGVPVVGAELAAHYDREGHVASIQANYVPDLDGVDLEPTFDAKAALSTVKADVLGRMPGVLESQLQADDGALIVFALGEMPARLAYEYRVRAIVGSEPAIWVTTVDAKTGEILDRYNNLQTVKATSAGALGDSKSFEVTQSGAGYVMTDTAGGGLIRTYTAANQEVTPGTQVTSNNLTNWDTGVTGAGAAVDAHVYAAVVYKYYKEKHARNAIDGAGGAMNSTAHFGQAYDNAFWDGTGMSYGDGGQVFRPLSAGLDVVAHEFSHGVTERTSNLRYQNQSGALNEAFSDIISAYVEHFYKPSDTNNWLLGESVSRGGGPLRDMKTPANGQQPAAMSQYRNTTQDAGGVHINSGIINNAAYLMTVGGVNPATKVAVKFGIGWDKAEKLWYRANTKYFLATTDFAQAAQGVLQAAKDIALTDNEQAIVDCAWKAVGISQGACRAIVDPKAPAPSAPPPDEGGGNPGEDESGGDVGDTGDTGEETPTPKKSNRTRLQQQSSGCSTSTRGGADFGAFAGLVAALGLVAARRRRR